MNKKILLRADIHAHPHAGSSRRAAECLQAMRWTYEVALANGCNYVVDLGDVFHERHHIDTWTFSEVYKIAKEYRLQGVNTIFVLGNHDMYFRDTATHNAIDAFESMFLVISEPKTITLNGRKFDVLPYIEKNPERALREAFPVETRADGLFFHGAFDGAIMSSASGMRRKKSTVLSHEMHEEEVPESVDPSSLQGWKKAWGGHYHTPQTFAESPCEAKYVGSVLQHNKGEAGEQKRVIVLDVDTLEEQDVLNNVSPIFIKIDGDQELPPGIDYSNARVVVQTSDSGSVLSQGVCKALREQGAIQVVREPKKDIIIDEEVQRLGIQNASAMIHDGGTMVRRYVKLQAPADLNPDKLIEIGMKIMAVADTGVS